MKEGARVGTLVVGGGGGASLNEENSTRVGAGVGVGVVEEQKRWGRWSGWRPVRCSVWEESETRKKNG